MMELSFAAMAFWSAQALSLTTPVSRRSAGEVALGGLVVATGPTAAHAVDVATKPLTNFKDPLFEVTYPSDFFSIRRKVSGDVVRRGGVIFTAGKLSTAEIVTVERFQISDLLAQADATSFFPDGSIAKWSDLGTPEALATYLCERRDNEATIAARGEGKARASQPVPGSIHVDETTIQADIVTDIGSVEMRVGEAGTKAQTAGVRRIQRARIFLLPGGKVAMGCWAGCLDDYWDQGESTVLCDVVASFRPVLAA